MKRKTFFGYDILESNDNQLIKTNIPNIKSNNTVSSNKAIQKICFINIDKIYKKNEDEKN